jgi:hypothetical protein
MKLYFNGCSHTYGDDLSSRDKSWPAVVARNLGHDFVNDSVSGGSNERILYRTVKHLQEFDKFYIAWTYTSRFTRYRADNNYEVNFNPQLHNSLYGSDPDFKTYGLLHYRVWHNELFCFKQWLQNIVLLQTYFKANNKRYVMLNADNNLLEKWTVDCSLFNDSVKSLLCFDLMNDDQLMDEHREITQLISQIDMSNFIGWNQWWLTKMCDHYPVGPTKHLLEQGHMATAEFIISHDTN